MLRSDIKEEHPDSQIVWDYSNRLVLWKDGFYFFWKKNTKAPHNLEDTYKFIGKFLSMEEGLATAIQIWDPPEKKKEKSLETIALSSIETIVSSIVNRNKIDQLKKSDFVFIYHDGNKWRAFFPTNKKLYNFHMENHSDKDNHECVYCNFLSSTEYMQMYQEWMKESMVIPGE